MLTHAPAKKRGKNKKKINKKINKNKK